MQNKELLSIYIQIHTSVPLVPTLTSNHVHLVPDSAWGRSAAVPPHACHRCLLPGHSTGLTYLPCFFRLWAFQLVQSKIRFPIILVCTVPVADVIWNSVLDSLSSYRLLIQRASQGTFLLSVQPLGSIVSLSGDTTFLSKTRQILTWPHAGEERWEGTSLISFFPSHQCYHGRDLQGGLATTTSLIELLWDLTHIQPFQHCLDMRKCS